LAIVLNRRIIMFYFVKLSSGWFGKEIESVDSNSEDIQAHAENGDIVVVMDDVDAFCEAMNVKESDIEFV